MSRADVFVLGTSHHVASGHVREQMHVESEELLEGLRRLLDRRDVLEVVPVITCARLELYGYSESSERDLTLLQRLVKRRSGLSAAELDQHTYVRRGADAVAHLFRVTAGLDSAVYGEAQVLGQVRDAYQKAATLDICGTHLHRLFQSALFTGKRVRSETRIGRGAASVASAAVRMLQREIKSLQDAATIVLGAGETGALVARLLRKRGVERLWIANRSEDRGASAAGAIGAETISLSKALQLIPGVDLVVGALAASPRFVTTASIWNDDHSRREQFFLDLAHPANFSAELAELPGVRLLTLEDVFERIQAVRRSRAAQVPRAREIVIEEAQRFDEWLRGRIAASRTVPLPRAVSSLESVVGS